MARGPVAGTKADPTLRFAEVELDGQTYKLAYNFNQIAEAESLAGCNLLSGLENLGDLTARQFRGLIYAALKIAHPDITIDQVGDLIGSGPVTGDVRFQKLGAALAQAYKLCLPDKPNPPKGGAAPQP